jgi:hypothetical protein
VARRSRKKATEPVVVKFVAKDFNEAIKETLRLQGQQSEYGGFANRHKQNFCKKAGYDQMVFSWLVRLRKLDNPLKAQELILQFIMGAEALEFLKQGDLFNDTSKLKERLHQAVAQEGEPKTPTGDEALQIFQRRLEENVDKAPTPAEVDAAVEKRAQRRRTVRVHDGPPSDAMRTSAAESDAFLKQQIAERSGNDVTTVAVTFPEPDEHSHAVA